MVYIRSKMRQEIGRTWLSQTITNIDCQCIHLKYDGKMTILCYKTKFLYQMKYAAKLNIKHFLMMTYLSQFFISLFFIWPSIGSCNLAPIAPSSNILQYQKRLCNNFLTWKYNKQLSISLQTHSLFIYHVRWKWQKTKTWTYKLIHKNKYIKICCTNYYRPFLIS